MQKPLDEEFVKRSIIKWLSLHEWGTNLQYGALRDKGVDIKVRHNRYSRYFLIEIKGDGKAKNLNSQREVNFNYALGQVLTRMITRGDAKYKYGYKYGIGFPISFKSLVLRRLPYSICNKLNLYIFFVYDEGKVEVFDWRKIKTCQVNKDK